VHANVVVQVEQLDQIVSVGQLVAAEVDLDLARRVLEVGEGGLPLRSPCRDPAGHPHLGTVFPHAVVVGCERLGGGVGAVEAIGEWRDAELLQLGQLLAPGGLDVIPLLGGAHAALPRTASGRPG